jgi:TolA-binding protein
MSVILIQNASGESSVRELSKQLPVAVGRHSSNDIQVPDPDVNILHCRISWNREAYEVIAGTATGVVINGSSVPSATLTVGDCIQVGTIAIFYYDNTAQLDAALRGEPVEAVSNAMSDSYPVQPVQGVKQPISGELTTSKRERESEPRRKRRSKRQETSRPRLKRKVKAESTESVQDFPVTDIDNQPPPHKELYIETPVLAPVQHGPVRLFDNRPVRPGEQDPWRSPLVLTLGIGTAVLIMVSIALWFVIGRDTSNKAYQTAIEEMEQKRYTQAITKLTEFLKNYPSHRFASAARHALGLSHVEQAIAGAAPDWGRAMENLNQYIDERKRDTDFPDMAPQISDLAERLAKGAAETAGVLKQPELLQISTDAARVLQTYSPADAPPKQALIEIDENVKQAVLAIRQHESFQAALDQIDKALKEKQPFAAFEVRRKLLLKYPSLESDSSLKSRMTKLLEAERKLIVKKVLDQAAQTTEPPSAVDNSALFLTRQSRTRPDTMASGTNVFTLVQETCVAVDSATGAIQWRRVVGLETPFPPHAVALDVLGLLLFNVQRSELLLVRQRDGGLIWRQVLPDPASAAPLVHAGQIFIPTRAGKLCQLDLVTGKLLSTLAFSQPLATSSVLVQNGERLIVAGDRAVLYTLNYRPLECLAVTYSGHAAGSIQAPLLKMGDFLLVEENDRQDSAQLRVWNLSVGDQPLVSLTSSRVEGQTREAAMLRGKQLVVPSSPERLSSFTVSDEKGERALTPAGTYAVDSPRGGAISVTLGPEDELWMTSSSLRRFQIGPDSLVPEKGQLSLGISTQPAHKICLPRRESHPTRQSRS